MENVQIWKMGRRLRRTSGGAATRDATTGKGLSVGDHSGQAMDGLADGDPKEARGPCPRASWRFNPVDCVPSSDGPSPD